MIKIALEKDFKVLTKFRAKDNHLVLTTVYICKYILATFVINLIVVESFENVQELKTTSSDELQSCYL